MAFNSDPIQRQHILADVAVMEESLARASDDYRSRRERLRRYLRTLIRPLLLREVRAAISGIDILDPANSAELERYVAAGFNAVVVADRKLVNDAWDELTGAEIEAKIELARSRNLWIILSCSAEANGDHPAMTAAEVKARIELWAEYDEGDVLGVFFLADDMCLIGTSAAQQKIWRAAVREVTTSIPVLGVIGEFGIDTLSVGIFDRDAFDHLLVLTYPYNLGQYWSSENELGVPVNHNIVNTVTDPDAQLREYIDTYYSVLNDKFFEHLYADQLIIPVIQAFNYVGEATGKLLRPDDVQLEMTYASEALRAIVPTQADNYAMTVFWWGSAQQSPLGLRDNNDWCEHARRANFTLRKAARAAAGHSLQEVHEVFRGGEL